MQESGQFDDIRPYVDSEVPEVLSRLARDPEFLDTLTSIKYPTMTKLVPWLLRPIAYLFIKKTFTGIDSVNALQLVIRKGLVRLLENTGTTVTASGLDQLDPQCSYLLLSNHRDITMDSTLVNLVFFQHGRDTIRSAAGDNLLSKNISSDLLRLNKSFVVKRSAAGKREKLEALKQLSSYIRFSILQENCSVWIAQREGRGKDGIDKTETALLKMLSLSKSKEQDFAGSINELNVVPVSISYEFDPCDADKARELYEIEVNGSYTKQEHEDIRSIYKGVVGHKGQVHIAIGKPIESGFETPDELTDLLDKAIISNYHLHATNLIAYEMLDGADAFSDRAVLRLAESGVNVDSVRKRFEERLSEVHRAHRDSFLLQYANPVRAAKRVSS